MAFDIDINAGQVTNNIDPKIFDIVLNKGASSPADQADFLKAVESVAKRDLSRYIIEDRSAATQFVLHTKIEEGEEINTALRKLLDEVKEEYPALIGHISILPSAISQSVTPTSTLNNKHLGVVMKDMVSRLEDAFTKGINTTNFNNLINSGETIDPTSFDDLITALNINSANKYLDFIKQSENIKEKDFTGNDANIKFIILQRLLRIAHRKLLEMKVVDILTPGGALNAGNFDYTKVTSENISKIIEGIGNSPEKKEYVAGVLRDWLVSIPPFSADLIAMLRFLTLPKGASIIDFGDLPAKTLRNEIILIQKTSNLSKIDPIELNKMAKVFGFENSTSIGFEGFIARLKLLSVFAISDNELLNLRYDQLTAGANATRKPSALRGLNSVEEKLDELLSTRVLNLIGVSERRPALYGEMVPYLRWIFTTAPAGPKASFITWLYSHDFGDITSKEDQAGRLDMIMENIQRECAAIPKIPSDPIYITLRDFKVSFIKSNIKHNSGVAALNMSAGFASNNKALKEKFNYINSRGSLEELPVTIKASGELPLVKELYLENRQALAENIKTISVNIEPFFRVLSKNSAYATIVELINSRERINISNSLVEIFQNLIGSGSDEFLRIIGDIERLLPDETTTPTLYTTSNKTDTAKVVTSRLLVDLLPLFTEKDYMGEFAEYRFNHRNAYMDEKTHKLVNELIDPVIHRVKIENVTYGQRLELTKSLDVMMMERTTLGKIEELATRLPGNPTKVDSRAIADQELEKLKRSGTEVTHQIKEKLYELINLVLSHPLPTPPYLSSDYNSIYKELDTSINNIFIIIGKREDPYVQNYEKSLERTNNGIDQSKKKIDSGIRDHEKRIKGMNLEFNLTSPEFINSLTQSFNKLNIRYDDIKNSFITSNNILKLRPRLSNNIGLNRFLLGYWNKGKNEYSKALAYFTLVEGTFTNFTLEQHQKLFNKLESKRLDYTATSLPIDQEWADKFMNGEARRALVILEKFDKLDELREQASDQGKNGIRIFGKPTGLLKSEETSRRIGMASDGISMGMIFGGALTALGVVAAPPLLPLAGVAGAAYGSVYAYNTMRKNRLFGANERKIDLLKEFNSLGDVAQGQSQMISQMKELVDNDGYIEQAKKDLEVIRKKYSSLRGVINNRQEIPKPRVTYTRIEKLAQQLEEYYTRLGARSTTEAGAENVRELQSKISEIKNQMDIAMLELINSLGVAAAAEIKPKWYEYGLRVEKKLNFGKPLRANPSTVIDAEQISRRYTRGLVA